MNNAIELQQLEQQYQNTLIQYKQALLDYRNAAQKMQGEYKDTSKAYYYGESVNYSQIKVNNVQECKALCSAKSNCDGGFISKGKGNFARYGTECYLRHNGGVANYSNDTNFDYTAFEKPNLSQYKRRLDLVESQLRNIIQQIQTAVNKNPSDKTTQIRNFAYKNLLVSKYDTLVKERTQLENEEREYKNLSNEYDDTFISTVQGNSQNSLWIFVTIAVVGITAGVLIM